MAVNAHGCRSYREYAALLAVKKRCPASPCRQYLLSMRRPDDSQLGEPIATFHFKGTAEVRPYVWQRLASRCVIAVRHLLVRRQPEPPDRQR